MSKKKYVNIVASLGSSPAVITELLWYLVREENHYPKEVRIITTTVGKGKFLEESFQDILYDLLNKLKLRVGFTLHDPFVPTNNEGVAYEDINSTEADTAFANLAFELIQEASADVEIPLIVSLAGGRKTMSSHMMASLQLLGRRDDRLIHLLINEPFETIKDYFHPEQEKKELTDWSGNSIKVEDATINALDVPFIPIRSVLNDKGVVYRNREELLREAQTTLNRIGSHEKIAIISFSPKKRKERVTITDNKGFSKAVSFSPKETYFLLSLLITSKLLNLAEVDFKNINSKEGKAAFAWVYSLIYADKDLEEVKEKKGEKIYIDRSFDSSWDIDLDIISPTRSDLIQRFNKEIVQEFGLISLHLKQVDKHNRNFTYVDISSIYRSHLKLHLSPQLKENYTRRIKEHPYYVHNKPLRSAIEKVWAGIDQYIEFV